MPSQKPSENIQLPKVLFVHDYRPEARALADLVRQLLLDYPPEKLHWWHCRNTPAYELPDLQAASVTGCCIPEKLVPNMRWAGAKSFILENFWAPRAARHLEHAIRRIKPDLVAALLFGWSVPLLARVQWPENLKLHVSLWDFPDTNGMKQVLGEERSRRFVAAIHRLVRRANSFDAISTGMLEELRPNTGRADGLLVHSGFEPHHLAALENGPVERRGDGVVRLAYIGTIPSEKDFSLVLKALRQIRTQLQKKIVVEFFGGRNYQSREWFESDWMTEHGMFTDDGLVEALRRCDWGIVVMDPRGEDLRYSRFSFPNKIGTCLSAGVPVLGWGNAQSTLAQIMQNHRLGHFTSATEASELQKFLEENLRLPSPRDLFRAEILQCALTEFNAAEMRLRLWRAWMNK